MNKIYLFGLLLIVVLFFPINGKSVSLPYDDGQTTSLLQQLNQALPHVLEYDTVYEQEILSIKKLSDLHKGKIIEENAKYNYRTSVNNTSTNYRDGFEYALKRIGSP